MFSGVRFAARLGVGNGEMASVCSRSPTRVHATCSKASARMRKASVHLARREEVRRGKAIRGKARRGEGLERLRMRGALLFLKQVSR